MTADQLAMGLVYAVLVMIAMAVIACFIGAAIIEWRPQYRAVFDDTPPDGLEDKRTLLERVQ